MSLWHQAVLLLCLALGVVFVGGGLFNIIYELEPNRCQMTYMNPSYDLIALRPSQEHTAPTGFAPLSPPPLALKYEFYRYYEGGRHAARSDGPTIPVLFIPGSGGSFRQARSLAGITLQRSKPPEARRTNFVFYTLYFQEEMSGVDGVALEAQVLFTNEAIRWILEKHSAADSGDQAKHGQSAAVQSVVLVAHSMGGMVARACLSAANYRHGSIRTIITLNTPHLAPVAALQSELADSYLSLLATWSNASNFAAPLGPLRDVAVLSIAGSFRDTLIPSELANMQPFGTEHSVSLLTTSIAGVWLETDHECILWCRQLTQALSSLLFQLVDPRTGMETRSLDERLRIFNSLSASRLAALLLLSADKNVSDADRQLEDSANDSHGFAMKRARQEAASGPSPVADAKLLALLAAEDCHELDADIVHFRAVEHTTYRFAIREVGTTASFFFLTNGAAFHLIVCPNDHGPAGCEDWTHLAELLPGQQQPEGSAFSLLVLEPSVVARAAAVYILFPKYGRPWSQGVFFGAQALSLPDERLVIATSSATVFSSESVLFPAPHSFFSLLVFPSFSRSLPLRYSLQFHGCQRQDANAPTSLPVLPPLAYHLSASSFEQVLVPNVSSSRLRFHQSSDGPVYLALISDPDCSYTLHLAFDARSYFGLLFRTSYQLAYLLLVWLLLAALLLQVATHRRLGLCQSFVAALRSVVAVTGPFVCLLLPLASHLASDRVRALASSLLHDFMTALFPLHRALPSPTDTALLFAASFPLCLSLAGVLKLLRAGLALLSRLVGPHFTALCAAATRPRILIVAFSVFAAAFIHPGIGLLLTLFSLLRAIVSPNVPLSTRNFLESVFLLDLAVFLLVLPSLVIWAKNLPFISFVDLIKWNSATVFASVASIHGCLARSGLSKGGAPSAAVFVALSLIAVCFGPVCAMAEYRTFAFASSILVLLSFDHLLALSQVGKTEKFS